MSKKATKQVAPQVDVQLTEQLLTIPTVSGKIRYLHSLNKGRSEIATILNIRYQHVRNVLVTPLKRA